MAPRNSRLAAAGFAALMMGCGAVAQTGDIQGTIVFADGRPVPAGRLTISVDDPAAPEGARGGALIEQTRPAKSDRVSFVLPAPNARVSPGAEIVVQLERQSDGMLLARGTAGYAAEKPVEVTLYPVMY